ncbi:hypothetical protein WOLCODRAFT_158582 [Wolfiporia cocos MD-104 SS10]|uniref:CxC1-like cysteine cluster associated with KDZ transposases domain-containing protein n=1 Tax=Wolfiporia cocos (strain MD-104) TaxID=742152 RepID=A0A2H3JSP9_WOLCO|nr:hypothetical protein WOLCODRAFT_158582 [Wolfiporia cocos MD-104 SS10]
MNQRKLFKERKRVRECYEMCLSALGPQSRKVLAEMCGDNQPMDIDDTTSMHDWMGDALQDDEEWETLPGEVRNNADFMLYKLRKRNDGHTWRQRMQNMDENWRLVLPEIMEAYVDWRYSDCRPNADLLPSCYDFEINVFDIYSLETSVHIRRPPEARSVAEAIVMYGYLGTTLINPSLVISLRTLELMFSLRLFKASLSIESVCKVICYLYKTPYRQELRTAISDVFDIYLRMRRIVDKQVLAVLGHDTPNWCALYACPACGYELDGEPPMKWKWLICMDGNNSLKCLATITGHMRGDVRVFEDSDYYLPQSYVDRFADEVQSRRQP